MTSSGRGTSPRCAHCGMPIEHCDGRFGEWMHSLTRRERCAGGVAFPETYDELVARQSRARCERNHRRRTG